MASWPPALDILEGNVVNEKGVGTSSTGVAIGPDADYSKQKISATQIY
jgi:hypothetical protein